MEKLIAQEICVLIERKMGYFKRNIRKREKERDEQKSEEEREYYIG